MSTPNVLNFFKEVPKLDAHNWNAYSMAMGHFLRLAGSVEIVDGTLKRPTTSSATLADEQAAWDTKSNAAMAYIFFSVDPSLQYLLSGASSAPEAWTKIKAHFQTDTFSYRVSLRTQMWRTVHDISKPVTVYIFAITSAASQLTAMNAKYAPTDAEICDAVLAGLDPSFSTTRSILSTRSPEPTLAEITSALLEAEKQRSMPSMAEGIPADPGRPDNLAMVAHGSGKRTGQDKSKWGNKSRDPEACDRCGEHGHVARHCFPAMPFWRRDQVRHEIKARLAAEEYLPSEEEFGAMRAEADVGSLPHI